MTKTPSPPLASGGKSRPSHAQEKNKRLAEALRRNLVKRKDKKGTDPESESSAD